MIRVTARRGTTKVEYALTIMLVGVSCALLVGTLGHRVERLYNGTDEPAGVPAPAAAPAPEDPPPDGGAGGKRHGNPGNGNNGNDKDAGNAQ